MAEAGALAVLLDAPPTWTIQLEGTDDQWLREAYFASRTNASKPRAVLDHGGRVCMSMHKVSMRRDLQWDEGAGRWANRFTGVAGSRIHWHFNSDKREITSGDARRLFRGEMCYFEQATSCTAAGKAILVAPLVAALVVFLLSGALATWILGLTKRAPVSSPRYAAVATGASAGATSEDSSVDDEGGESRTAGDESRPEPSSPPSSVAPENWRTVVVPALTHAVVVGPLLMAAALVLACPVCSRPVATPAEVASGMLWPPTDYLFGRGLVTSLCIAFAAALPQLLASRYGSSWRGTHAGLRVATLAVTSALAAGAGAPVLSLCSGGLSTAPGCFPLLWAATLAGAAAHEFRLVDVGV